MESLDHLEDEIKKLIIESLALEDVRPEDIDPMQPLFVEGLGLDSIDALEITGVLERLYGVKADSNDDRNRERYACVRNLARWIAQTRSDVRDA